MSSWGPGFVKSRANVNLSHYHYVSFGSFQEEYFKLVRSVMYTLNLKEFLFVFDKVNSVSSSIGLFEYTLKKNSFIRFLPYYPSTGFNIGDRKDLVEPAIHKNVPDRPSFFQVFSTMFSLQDKVKQSIQKIYDKTDISVFTEKRIGVCISDGDDVMISIAKLQTYLSNSTKLLNIFVSSSKEQYQAFKQACPSDWIVYSMWDALPSIIKTEEQKMDVFYALLGSIKHLVDCYILLGSHRNTMFRFLYCKEEKFRNPMNGVVLDGSSFSYF
jgi:hypothetical protein